jgi:hypothetical protein
VRGISVEDFIKSLKAIRPSVSESDLKQYEGTIFMHHFKKKSLTFLSYLQIGIKHMARFNSS